MEMVLNTFRKKDGIKRAKEVMSPFMNLQSQRKVHLWRMTVEISAVEAHWLMAGT